MQKSLRAVCMAACLLGAFFISSCAVNQTLIIADDGTGTLATHVELSRVLRDYFANLSQASGDADTLKNGAVFDAGAIRKDFQSRPGIVVNNAATPAPGILDLDLGFDSLQDVLRGQNGLESVGAVILVDEGDRKILKLHLDRSTFGQLAALFPPLRDPLVQQLGPQGTGKVTEADYLAMIRFSIGDEAPGLLKKSFITLTVRPQGEILSQSGGSVAPGDNEVVFRIPVLRVLVLDRPLDYSVTFRGPG